MTLRVCALLLIKPEHPQAKPPGSLFVSSWYRFFTYINVFSDDTINNSTPALPDIPRGRPGDVDKGKPQYTFKSDRIQTLGLQYRTLTVSARQAVISMRENGW